MEVYPSGDEVASSPRLGEPKRWVDVHFAKGVYPLGDDVASSPRLGEPKRMDL